MTIRWAFLALPLSMVTPSRLVSGTPSNTSAGAEAEGVQDGAAAGNVLIPLCLRCAGDEMEVAIFVHNQLVTALVAGRIRSV